MPECVTYFTAVRETIGLGGGGAMYCPAVSPHASDLMFVQCDMGGLYRSVNGGGTWTMVDGREMTASLNPMRCHVAFDPRPGQHRAYAYGAYRGIRRSDDGGATWPTVLVDDPGGGLRVTALAVSPQTGDLLLYGTETGVATVAGAQTHPGPVGRFFVDPNVPTNVYVLIRGATNGSPPGGVFRSTNGGAAWTPISTAGLTPSPATMLDFGAGSDPATGEVILYVTVATAIVGGVVAGGSSAPSARHSQRGRRSWVRTSTSSRLLRIPRRRGSRPRATTGSRWSATTQIAYW